MRRTDRFAKTIVFCVDQEHADEMRRELNNLNADLVKDYPRVHASNFRQFGVTRDDFGQITGVHGGRPPLAGHRFLPRILLQQT
jgi:hypothetical protein